MLNNKKEEKEMSAKTAPIVDAIDVKKTYMLGKVPVEALRGVNLKVESGDLVLHPSPVRQRQIHHAKFNRRAG